MNDGRPITLCRSGCVMGKYILFIYKMYFKHHKTTTIQSIQIQCETETESEFWEFT